MWKTVSQRYKKVIEGICGGYKMIENAHLLRTFEDYLNKYYKSLLKHIFARINYCSFFF